MTTNPLNRKRSSAARELFIQHLNSTRIIFEMVISNMNMLDDNEINTRMNLRLLAAELRGQPWPIDPNDPTGKPYRRFERDGKLIGAYSVGKNGIDEGGISGDDRCIDLYGVCKPPKP